MTGYRCRCGAGIFYDSVKQKETECKCGQKHTVTKDGTLQPIPSLEEFNLDKRDPLKEK